MLFTDGIAAQPDALGRSAKSVRDALSDVPLPRPGEVIALVGIGASERDDLTRAREGNVTERIANGLGTAAKGVGLGGDTVGKEHAGSTFHGAGGQSPDDEALGKQGKDHGG